MIEKHIINFLNEIKNEKYIITSVEINDGLRGNIRRIYNEESLCIELGNYLSEKLPNYRVEYERNVKRFGINKNKAIKSEIDIVVFDDDINEKYAIELKFPRNGQYPEEMFNFVEDIKFKENLEDKKLKDKKFDRVICLVIADDSKFYSNEGKTSGIYGYFRTYGATTVKCLSGAIKKPTGKEDKKFEINLENNYTIKWNYLCATTNGNDCMYYLV